MRRRRFPWLDRLRWIAAVLAVTSSIAVAETTEGLGEAWSVQTVAVRDLRTAQAIAGELLSLGFDAYTEFAMSDGQQWVRVRVGCFLDRSDAEQVAGLLQGRYTRDAVVVPWSGVVATVSCLERQIGFVVPDRWQQHPSGAAAFEVEVAGVVGLMRFQDARWQLLQAPATDALDPLPETASRFDQGAGFGRPFVTVRTTDGRQRLVCAGTLLAQTEEAAIVVLDGVVSACLLGDAPTGAAP